MRNKTRQKKTLAPPKDLVLAAERIGHTSIKRLKWLLTFSALDLNGLSQGQLSDLVWEIKAFLFPPDIQSVIQKHSNDGYRVLFVVLENEPGDRGAISVEKFQAFVKHGIESGFHGGWEFTYPKRTEKVGFKSKEGEVTPLEFDVTSARQAFEVTVFDLMKAERDRIGLCANERCRKPFMTEKEDKGRFCSPRCSAYVRMSRFREKSVRAT
jgi:hypothetical protein